MSAGDPEYLKRIAERNALLAAKEVTQPNVPEGLPATAPTLGGTLPGVQPVVSVGWSLVALATLDAALDPIVTSSVPTTTKALMIVVRSGGGPVASTLRGIPSLTNYFAPVGAIRGATMVPVNGLEDQVYALTCSSGVGVTIAIYASDSPVGHISQGTQSSTRSVPVTMASDQIFVSGWLAANQAPASTSRTSAGTTHLIAPTGAQTVYLFGLNIDVDVGVAGGFAALQDTSGNQLLRCPGTQVGTNSIDLHGAALPIGVGVDFATVAAITAGCSVAYSLV